MSHNPQSLTPLLDELYLRLPDGMRHRLEALSTSHGTSVQAEILRAIDEYLANQARLNILAMTQEAKVSPRMLSEQKAPCRNDDIDYLDGLHLKSR